MYRLFGKRLIDFILALILLVVCLPVFLLAAILIKFDSPGPVFFTQKRMGKNGALFSLFKLRTMFVNPAATNSFEPGSKSRITRIGRFLRKAKIDEFPQLLNVLIGHMSFVGPRPEVPKYKKFYSGENFQILNVRPGITDMASIKYSKEEELLAESKDPERYYSDIILPDKLRINLNYINNKITLLSDFNLILNTLFKLKMRDPELNESLILHYRKIFTIIAHFAVIISSYLMSYLLRF